MFDTQSALLHSSPPAHHFPSSFPPLSFYFLPQHNLHSHTNPTRCTLHTSHLFRRRYRRSIDILCGSDDYVRHFREPNRFFPSPVHEPRPFTVVVVRRRRSGVAHRISHGGLDHRSFVSASSVLSRGHRLLLGSDSTPCWWLRFSTVALLFLLTTMGGTVHRANPFIVVVVVVVQPTVRIVMSRLSFLAVVSIDHRSNWMRKSDGLQKC